MLYLGQIVLVTYGVELESFGLVPCDGRLYKTENGDGLSALLSVIGNKFGGDGNTTFCVPKIPPPPGLKALHGYGYYICFSGDYPTSETDWYVVGRVEEFASTLPQGIAPAGYSLCDGSSLQESTYPELSSVLAGAYGTPSAGAFSLPSVPPTISSPVAQAEPLYCIATSGQTMSYTPWDLVGQLILLPTPAGPGILSDKLQGSGYYGPFVLPCNGQTVPIQDYEELFFTIGLTYGGDGVNVFGLPSLSPPPGLEHHSYFIVSRGTYPSHND